MKFLLPALLLMLLCQNLYGQTDADFRKIIEDCIRAKQDTGNVVYLDTASLIDPAIKRVLNKKKIEGMISDAAWGEIFLSKSEIKFIVRKSQNREKIIWPDSLFNKARKISYFDSIYQTRGNYKIKLFAFSQPVFIRNNSICVFQLIFMYGYSAGYKQLYFYRKENEIWKKWLLIDLGAW
jgi:hypothetical protein